MIAVKRCRPLHRVAAWLSIIILVGLLTSGCCTLIRRRASEMPDDGPPVATSQEAALRFVEKLTVAGRDAARTGTFELTLTQEEVTSFFSTLAQVSEEIGAMPEIESLEDLDKLPEGTDLAGIENLDRWRQLLQEREGLPEIRLPNPDLRVLIVDPQVYFKAGGQIVVRGYSEFRDRQQPLRIVMAPRVSEGGLELDFVEGRLGAVPLPEILFDRVGSGLARIISAGEGYVEVTKVQVGDGVLTISGRSVR